MEWLKIMAMAISIADGINSCNAINSGKGIEANRIMIIKTCKGIIIQKTALTVPMYAFKNRNIQTGFMIANTAGGTIGLTFSIHNLKK